MNIVEYILFFVFSQFAISGIDGNSIQVNELAAETISLEKRYDNSFVNGVFKDNILLNMAYLSGKVTKRDEINWDEIHNPFNYRFTLAPDKTFAFHEDVLEKYKNSLVRTTNAHFNYDDGFKSDGYLTGDGVCHLASLMYWVAKKANLDTYAPTNHDFRAIPEISREYGVSIYKTPGSSDSNAKQNLYITNNKKNPIVFEFDYEDTELKFSIFESVNSGL